MNTNVKKALKVVTLFVLSFFIADAVAIAEIIKYNLTHELIISYENPDQAVYKMYILYGLTCIAGGYCLYFLLNRNIDDKLNFEKKQKMYYVHLAVMSLLAISVWYVFNKFIIKTEIWEYINYLKENIIMSNNLIIDEVSAYCVNYAITLDITRTAGLVCVFATYPLTRFLFDNTILESKTQVLTN